MGAHTSLPDRLQASSCSAFVKTSNAYAVTDSESSGKEKKKKLSKFATLRKKLIKVRRHSRSLDHGKAMRELLSNWPTQDITALVQEYEATATLKELSIAASLARPSSHSLRHDLSKLFDYKFCTDVDLIFKGVCFPVHRAILSIRSPFFKNLLAKYPEYGAQVAVKLRTSGVNVHLFSALLKYLYTNEFCGEELTEESSEVVGRIASEFGIPNVLEHDMKQLLDSGELADAVLVFSVDSENTDMSSSFQGSSFNLNNAQNLHSRNASLEFPCHRAIIASRSPFFRNLINRRAKSGEELTERTLRTPSRIVLDETVIPRRYARVLLTALYQDNVDMTCILRGSPSMCSLSEIQAMVSSGRCQMTVVDEAMELYQIGQFLDSQVIAQGCEDIIVENLSMDCLMNVLTWSAEPHGSKWVHRQALNFLIEEFSQAVHSSVLLDLNSEIFKECLASDYLQCSELDALNAVVKWGEHQLVKRIEEREPNLLTHTAHSVAKKGVKKRDLNDFELKNLLSDILPLIRVDHILPVGSDTLSNYVKRGFLEIPMSHTHGDDILLHRISAWTGLTNRGVFLKPRLFTPYYEEAKNILEELMSTGQEVSGRVRAIHLSAIPDTLYMLEDKDCQLPLPYSGSPASTVDVIAGTVPVPDRETFVKMLEREQELLQSKPAQRASTLPCWDKRAVALNAALNIQLRVVREFGLPDNALEVLQNSQYYYTNKSCRHQRIAPSQTRKPASSHPHMPLQQTLRENSVNDMSLTFNYRSLERESCSESVLSEVMPDIAMAASSLSQVHLHTSLEPPDIGDGAHPTIYI